MLLKWMMNIGSVFLMNMIPFIRNNHFMLLAGHKRTYNKWTYFEIFSLLCTHDTMNQTIIYDIKLKKNAYEFVGC